MVDNGLEEALLIAGCVVGGLVIIFLLTFPTGCAPRPLLSLESRIMRCCKKRKKWSWTTIDNCVYLGSLPRFPCHLEELKTEGVGAVLTLNESWELSMSSQAVQDCGMVSRQLPTPDFFAPTHRDIVEAVAFIRSYVRQGISVFVHCNGGKGRSAVCVICYLIYEHDWSPDEAFKYVKGRRSIANMKVCGGLHKQWRAVKRFARELKLTRKQMAYAAPGERQHDLLVPKNASPKVVPLPVAAAAPPLAPVAVGEANTAQGTPGLPLGPDIDCEAQAK